MNGKETTWRIEGMHCPHCETAVLRAVKDAKGIGKPRADYKKGQLTAVWDAAKTSEAELAQRLAEAGYILRGQGSPADWKRIVIALAAAAAAFCLFAFTPLQSRLASFPTAEAGMSLGALFMVGLTTSLHCVAMCGGINLAQSAAQAQKQRGVWEANLLYNLGRVVSYTVTGAVVGALGSVLRLTTTLQAVIQGLAAAFMVLMALNLLDASPLRGRLLLPTGLRARLLGRHAASSLWVGLVNGLMPCGPLQAMQLFALGTGSWSMGALSMLAFSLGTVPLMLGFGLVSGRLNRRFARPMRWISGLLVLVMGMSMLTNALSLAGVSLGVRNDGVTRAIVRDGVQTVHTEMDYHEYPPFTVQAGIPVQWTLHVEPGKLTSCNREIVIPSLNMRVSLQNGDNLIEFTPQEVGEIPFSCWMGMVRSAITVE